MQNGSQGMCALIPETLPGPAGCAWCHVQLPSMLGHCQPHPSSSASQPDPRTLASPPDSCGTQTA